MSLTWNIIHIINITINIYIIIATAAYFLTDVNELCVHAVDNLEKCKEAVKDIEKVIDDAYFVEREVHSNYPKGCYLYTHGNGRGMYFNEHSTGSNATNARHVCKVQGKEQFKYSPRVLVT